MRSLVVFLFLACMDGCLSCFMSTSRMVGGSEVDISEVPYMAEIRERGLGGVCGATIIGAEWVATAAHCIHYPQDNDRYEIRAGSIWRGQGSVHPTAKVIRHKSFDPKTGDYDIALIKVSKPFKIGKRNVKAAGLPKQGAVVKEGTMATVSGWGTWLVLVQNLFEVPGLVLRAVDVPIVDRQKCITSYRKLKNSGTITDRNICAGFEKGRKDACSGDSGGPLVVDGVLVGIVSWANGCGKRNFPGIYVNVAAFRNWIKKNTRI